MSMSFASAASAFKLINPSFNGHTDLPSGRPAGLKYLENLRLRTALRVKGSRVLGFTGWGL